MNECIKTFNTNIMSFNHKTRKNKEQLHEKQKESIMNDNIDIIVSATGCSNIEAYIMLRKHCNSISDVLNKMRIR